MFLILRFVVFHKVFFMVSSKQRAAESKGFSRQNDKWNDLFGEFICNIQFLRGVFEPHLENINSINFSFTKVVYSVTELQL